jgi:3-oxoadipate enol-lactonase
MALTTPIHRSVPTCLGSLHVEVHGAGSETLVLWPSIFTDMRIYDGLCQRLGNICRLVLIDGPGHGRSSGPGRTFSLGECGKAITEVMAAHEISRAVVGGTSWGGMAAVHLARQSPECVRGLLLMNTPMTIDRHAARLSQRMIALGARWLMHTSAYRNGVAESFFSSATLDQNQAYARHFDTMLRKADVAELANAVRSVLLMSDPLMVQLTFIQHPALVIAGEDDAMYPMRTQVEASLRLQNGTINPVPGKHISVVEAPDAVAQSIISFLARLDRTP